MPIGKPLKTEEKRQLSQQKRTKTLNSAKQQPEKMSFLEKLILPQPKPLAIREKFWKIRERAVIL